MFGGGIGAGGVTSLDSQPPTLSRAVSQIPKPRSLRSCGRQPVGSSFCKWVVRSVILFNGCLAAECAAGTMRRPEQRKITSRYRLIRCRVKVCGNRRYGARGFCGWQGTSNLASIQWKTVRGALLSGLLAHKLLDIAGRFLLEWRAFIASHRALGVCERQQS